MNFSEQKKKQFERQDKSNKQSIDKEIAKLVDKINSCREYYTTSSCAGRIILIKDNEKKKEGLFLFRTHKKVSLNELKKELEKSINRFKELIYFKQEPCILHVACKSINAAQSLIDKAKFCGFKRSGIMATRNRIICELMSTESIALPIANKGKILISENYAKLLVKEVNQKLSRVRKKINKLYNLLK